MADTVSTSPLPNTQPSDIPAPATSPTSSIPPQATPDQPPEAIPPLSPEEAAQGPSNKRTAAEVDKLVKKILFFKNPYDVLESQHEMSMDEIRSHYKRLTLMVHPDKCLHPQAGDAISALSKAMKICENPSQRMPFVEVVEKAREKVTQDWQKRAIERDELSEEAFQYEVRRETHAMIVDIEKRMQKADEMQRANDKHVKEERFKLQEGIKKKEEDTKAWESRRTERVQSWRSFVQKKAPPGKKPKYKAGMLKPPKLKKDERDG